MVVVVEVQGRGGGGAAGSAGGGGGGGGRTGRAVITLAHHTLKYTLKCTF